MKIYPSARVLLISCILYLCSFTTCSYGRKAQEVRCGNLTHCIEDLNNWDYLAIGLLVSAIGCTLATIWLSKNQNENL